jgi:hypothetical protein
MADDLPVYIYGFAAVCGALLVGFGGIVLTISTKRLRQARIWFLLSALPFFAIPITYGWSARSGTVGLSVAAISALFLGMIYYAGVSILNEYINHADQDSRTGL